MAPNHFSEPRRTSYTFEARRVLGLGHYFSFKNGVYQAAVEASYDNGKTWVQKTAKNHTFFPNGWDSSRVVREVVSAFKKGRIHPIPSQYSSFDWIGRSESGVLIAGYLKNGKIVTAFPIWGA